jgi:hypothetical protein
MPRVMEKGGEKICSDKGIIGFKLMGCHGPSNSGSEDAEPWEMDPEIAGAEEHGRSVLPVNQQLNELLIVLVSVRIRSSCSSRSWHSCSQ